MTQYRYPGEQAILMVTVVLVGAVLVLSALPTMCLVPIAALVFIAITYQSSQAHHRQLLNSGTLVSPQHTPRLAQLALECVQRLRPGAVQFFSEP